MINSLYSTQIIHVGYIFAWAMFKIYRFRYSVYRPIVDAGARVFTSVR